MATPAASTPAPGKFGFWSNWRQYTLADLLQGKSPIPSAPTAEASAAPSTPESTTPPVSAPVADVGQREVVNLPASVAAPVMDAGQIANLPPPVVDAGQRQAAALPPVQVRQVVNLPSLSYWTGFAEPAAIATTAQGHVLVVDAGQKIIFRFNADGQPLGQWPVAELPSSPNYNLAASPDGKTLYIADPANRRVQVISL